MVTYYKRNIIYSFSFLADMTGLIPSESAGKVFLSSPWSTKILLELTKNSLGSPAPYTMFSFKNSFLTTIRGRLLLDLPSSPSALGTWAGAYFQGLD